jgi:hypothetical protein
MLYWPLRATDRKCPNCSALRAAWLGFPKPTLKALLTRLKEPLPPLAVQNLHG